MFLCCQNLARILSLRIKGSRLLDSDYTLLLPSLFQSLIRKAMLRIDITRSFCELRDV